jgi:hypothetical protein
MSKSLLQIFIFNPIFFIFKILILSKKYIFLGYFEHNQLSYNPFNTNKSETFSIRILKNLAFVRKKDNSFISLIYNNKEIAIKNLFDQIKYASNNEDNVYLIVVKNNLDISFLKKVMQIKNCNLILLNNLDVKSIQSINVQDNSKVYFYLGENTVLEPNFFQLKAYLFNNKLKPLIFIFYFEDNASLIKKNNLIANSYCFFNLKTIF